MSSYSELKKKIIQDSAKQLIPVGGEFELTARCNLQCQMCYVREDNSPELTTEQWLKIFRQARDNGLFFALLTGGEVFLRKDFITLYNALYDMGVKITIYTNGTLITEEHAQALAVRPPEAVGITLYGSNNDTYLKVTKNRNGFNEVNRGIDLLKKYNINIFLRTIAIPDIYPDVDNIIEYAKSKNLIMHYSLYVGPRRNLCGKDISNRLTPSQIIEYEKKFVSAFSMVNNKEFKNSENGFSCVALKSAYFITYEGLMQPCAMLGYPSASIIINDFNFVWKQLQEKMKKISKCHDCSSCNYNNYCIQCPAKLYLEGDFSKCSSYLKEIAILRSEVEYGDL